MIKKRSLFFRGRFGVLSFSYGYCEGSCGRYVKSILWRLAKALRLCVTSNDDLFGKNRESIL